MDVGEWLRSLGLGQYEATFRDNAIGMDILTDLTEGDLEKIGVPLGYRRRLLKAISNLGAAEAPANPYDSPTYGIVTRCRRAPSDHGHVLRPGGLDQPRGEARSRGLAQSGRELPRRSLGGHV
jgi:hypothetical protein